MATNFYFNNFQASMEQQLIEDLCIESIRVYGHDLYYLPRTVIDRDEIFAEDDISEYNLPIPIEMYIKNVDGFGGDGDFLSKFNIQIRDTITFTVARRVFYDEMATNNLTGFERPREGDLIYFPLNKKVFKITFVEHEDVFYQLGALQMWDLKCELFEYGGETFNTGIDEIDRIEWEYSLASNPLALLVSGREFMVDEFNQMILYTRQDVDDLDPGAQNEEIELIADGIIDFTEIDPFSEGEY